MSRVMVDTNVLVYATRRPRAKDAPEVADLTRRAKHLIAKLDPIRISSISMLEFLRGLRADEQEAGAELLSRTEAEAVDAVIATRANELLTRRVSSLPACALCFNAKTAATCKGCKRLVGAEQRLRDALIVATADILRDVDVLYTFDGGVIAFGEDAKGVSIQRPDSADGPLFNPVD